MYRFFSLFLFALTVCLCMCLCLFTNRCLCLCVSVLACGSMSSGYTDTHAHTCPALAPCACSRMAFEPGPEQSCALVDCHSSLNLLPDQSPPPSEPVIHPPSPLSSPQPWLLTPSQTLGHRATTDTRPGTSEKEGERSYCEISGCWWSRWDTFFMKS